MGTTKGAKTRLANAQAATNMQTAVNTTLNKHYNHAVLNNRPYLPALSCSFAIALAGGVEV